MVNRSGTFISLWSCFELLKLKQCLGLIIIVKWKCLDLIRECEIIQLYEVGGLSKSEIWKMAWSYFFNAVHHFEEPRQNMFSVIKEQWHKNECRFHRVKTFDACSSGDLGRKIGCCSNVWISTQSRSHFTTPEIENTPCFVGWLYCFIANKDTGMYSVSGKLPAFRTNL